MQRHLPTDSHNNNVLSYSKTARHNDTDHLIWALKCHLTIRQQDTHKYIEHVIHTVTMWSYSKTTRHKDVVHVIHTDKIRSCSKIARQRQRHLPTNSHSNNLVLL